MDQQEERNIMTSTTGLLLILGFYTLYALSVVIATKETQSKNGDSKAEHQLMEGGGKKNIMTPNKSIGPKDSDVSRVQHFSY